MKYIVFSFVAFALFIGTLVTICVKQNISLVSATYYEDDLQYEKKQTRRQNADQLEVLPAVSLADHQLNIMYEQMPSVESGLIKLTRPSDSDLDQAFIFDKQLGTHHSFNLAHTKKGLYRISISWKMSNKEYLVEKTIVL
ncbi:MAG: FixH family protein [Flammeovirgaceae bacterium]